MPNEMERLRAWQALGWARRVLAHDRASYPGGSPKDDAYGRGLAGEPPPCGCVAVLREQREQHATLAARYAELYPGSEAAAVEAYAAIVLGEVPRVLRMLGVTEGQDGSIYEETTR